MDRILCGIETEYGMAVEGRGAEDQIDEAMTLVRAYPGESLSFLWDYSLESPRSDLRGFRLDRLAFDPQDARFDSGRPAQPSEVIRSDQVLANGARFYNDHGHPEYSTPECWSIQELAVADKAGEIVVRRAAEAYAAETGRQVSIFKNNTDFHGASYGTHESYLCPRELGFERLCRAVLPLLVARQVLTGAGKAGSEKGGFVPFQISQRADFFVEPFNAETLYRRPIFNTRDEPHADPRQWIRLHVISGDANMMASCTARKAGLVKLALMLEMAGECPVWRLSRPVEAFMSISRGPDEEGRVDLEGGSWTTPRHILEAYLDAAERVFDLEPELDALVQDCRRLLEARFEDHESFARSVDWAAKRSLLSQYRESEGLEWSDPAMQSLDLAYCDLDPENGLFPALCAAGLADVQPDDHELQARLAAPCEPTRALARAAAVQRLKGEVKSVSWSSIRFKSREEEVVLDPSLIYPEALLSVDSVDEFVATLAEAQPSAS